MKRGEGRAWRRVYGGDPYCATSSQLYNILLIVLKSYATNEQVPLS